MIGFFIDTSLSGDCWSSKNIAIFSTNNEVLGNQLFDLSGKSATTRHTSKAPDGKEPGEHGAIGKDGEIGGMEET